MISDLEKHSSLKLRFWYGKIAQFFFDKSVACKGQSRPKNQFCSVGLVTDVSDSNSYP